MKELTDIIINNGVAIAVVVYFMYKDITQNNKIIESFNELTNSIKELTIRLKNESED